MAIAAANAPTVLSSWTRVLVTALREQGIDPEPLVVAAGLDPASIAAPDARFPIGATTRLWQLAVRETGDEALGLQVSKYSTQTTFHALGYAFMASSTLLQAMERVVRFNGMVSDAATAVLSQVDGNSSLHWTLQRGGERPANEALEAVMASIIRASRRRQGPGFAPQKVELARPCPREQDRFRDFFRCAINFDAPGHAMHFETRKLQQPLPDGNEALAQSNDRVVEEYLARLELGSVMTRLRTLLVNQLPSGVQSQDFYARRLGLSGRSLQRKLQAEGTSFSQVLNETRCELAKSYLGSGQRPSLTEIAFLLGFSDTSSFSRAFHRWTGVAPSAY